MSRYNNIEDESPMNDSILCCRCRSQVAYFDDFLHMSHSGVGLFDDVFNVNVADYASSYLGNTVAKTYCRDCGKMIGWEIIEVTQPSEYIMEGRFCMRLSKLSFWNHLPLLSSDEENADQDGDTTSQLGDSTDQDGDATDQDLGANGQNADQDGDANEQVPNEQEVGANEQNVGQDGDSDEEYDGAIYNFLMHLISQNANQDLGANEQNADQDLGANDQNADQDLGANEQNAEQDGGANADQNEGANADQDGGANADQNEGANADQDGGANADQDGDANEQNHEQDGGRPIKRKKM